MSCRFDTMHLLPLFLFEHSKSIFIFRFRFYAHIELVFDVDLVPLNMISLDLDLVSRAYWIYVGSRFSSFRHVKSKLRLDLAYGVC